MKPFVFALLAVFTLTPTLAVGQRPLGTRGRIGVIVNVVASPGTDSLGARVEAVTPGGPAAKAGLQAGDIITRFNGTSLGGVPGEEAEESGPGHRLVQLARELAPGDTVAIEYRRNGAARKGKLVAQDLGGFRGMGEMPEPRGLAIMGPPGFPGFSFCMGDGWCDMELVALNSDLGDYFGVKDGILVVKAPADSSLPLKSGDVLLSIGGRRPTSPSHAMRILRSYEAGETVTLEVMRKQKRLSVPWQVPRSDGPMRSLMPRMHQMVSDSAPVSSPDD